MEEPPPKSDWASLRSVYNSATLCSLGFFMVGFLIPIIVLLILDGSPTQLGLVFAMLTLGSAIFSPVAGRIAKQGRRRLTVFIGAIVRALSYIGMAAAILLLDINLLILNSLTWGLGAAFYKVGMDAEISERVLPQNRSEAFGRRSAANGRGSTFGAFLAFGIISSFSDTMVGIMAVLLVFAASNVLGGLVIVTDKRPIEKPPEKDKAQLLREAIGVSIAALVVAAALDTFITALLSPFVEAYILQVFTSDILLVSLIYLPGGLISAFLGGTMGRFADHSSKIGVVSAAVLMGAISTLGLVFIPQILGEPFNLISIGVLFAIGSATATMAFTVMSAVFGTAYEGRAEEGFGLYEAAIGFAQFSAPIIGGLLWEGVSPEAPFLLVGLSGFILIPIYVYGMKKYESAVEIRKPES